MNVTAPFSSRASYRVLLSPAAKTACGAGEEGRGWTFFLLAFIPLHLKGPESAKGQKVGQMGFLQESRKEMGRSRRWSLREKSLPGREQVMGCPFSLPGG